jgi:hypothetical protein
VQFNKIDLSLSCLFYGVLVQYNYTYNFPGTLVNVVCISTYTWPISCLPEDSQTKRFFSEHSAHSLLFLIIVSGTKCIHMLLKGQCHEIFDFRLSTWISLPQAPEYTIRAVSNFFENSRRYSQLKVPMEKIFNLKNFHYFVWTPAGVVDTGGNFAAGVVDPGGKFPPGVLDTGGVP